MNYIICYPYSGSTFLRYCIEHLTGYATDGHRGVPGSGKLQEPLLNKGKDFIAHKINFWPKHITRNDTAILLIRDYHEAIIRSIGGSKKINNENFEKETAGRRGDYIGMIQNFDAFDGQKYVIYYEDLIAKHNPLLPLKEAFSFNNFMDYVRSYGIHKKNAMAMHPSPRSFGEKEFHYKKYRRKIGKEWMYSIQMRFPEIEEKYLKRYRKG